MAVASQELNQALREPTPFFKDDGVTVRAWGDVPVPWWLRLLGWFFKLVKLPQNVAFVPDGNRRFARSRGLPIHQGHVMGLSVLEKFLAAAPDFGFKKSITFLFSVNNFQRGEEEKFNYFSELLRVANSICENQYVKMCLSCAIGRIFLCSFCSS